MSSGAIFLPFDTELGGVTENCSILTAHFAICDSDWNILDELDLKMKPDNNEYVLTAGGMAVNKIDILEHDKDAMTYSQAGGKLREFLWANSMAKSIKLIPVGKGVQGDVNKITSQILKSKNFHEFVSYRCYDITPLIIFLKRTGRLERDAPESLQELGEYLGIHAEWHTARGDNIAGIKLIQKLEDMCL